MPLYEGSARPDGKSGQILRKRSKFLEGGWSEQRNTTRMVVTPKQGLNMVVSKCGPVELEMFSQERLSNGGNDAG